MKVSRNPVPGAPPGPGPGRAALGHSGGPSPGRSTQRSHQKRGDLGKKQQRWAGPPAGSLLPTAVSPSARSLAGWAGPGSEGKASVMMARKLGGAGSHGDPH